MYQTSFLCIRRLQVEAVFLQGRRKGGVLVHCFAGQSRSVALILAYLIQACALLQHLPVRFMKALLLFSTCIWWPSPVMRSCK